MNEFQVDKLRVRRAFDRAARTYAQHARLQALVRDEMLMRLHGLKIEPHTVVDMGCGSGEAVRVLRQRYPRARVVGLDFSSGMLQEASRWRPWVRKPMWLCGDMERLPLRDASVDLLFSSLSVQWGNDLAATFSEARRVLKPGGVFMFSTLGPDTLKELRAAWRSADGGQHAHVNMFLDMHDVGDALLRVGLRDPVMDVERMTLRYADVDAIMRSLKGIGAQNSTQGRARGLTTRTRLLRVCEAYEEWRGGDGLLPVTYEVVHGLAWGGEAGRFYADAAGEVKVPLHALLGRTKK